MFDQPVPNKTMPMSRPITPPSPSVPLPAPSTPVVSAPYPSSPSISTPLVPSNVSGIYQTRPQSSALTSKAPEIVVIAAPRPRKSNAFLIIIIVVALVAMGGGAIAALMFGR
jgi:hypothetical protein